MRRDVVEILNLRLARTANMLVYVLQSFLKNGLAYFRDS